MRARTFYKIYAFLAVGLECAALSFAQKSFAGEAHQDNVHRGLAGSAIIMASETRGFAVIEPWSCKQLSELSADQQREALPLTDLPEIDRFCALDDGGDCSEYAGGFAGIGALKPSSDERYCAIILFAELKETKEI